MTRREKNRLLREEAERKRLQEELDKKIRRVTGILLAINILLGIGVGVLLLAFTAYGMLTAQNVVQMALYPALAAVVLFPLLYGMNFAMLHKAGAAQPQKQKAARDATAAALCAALLAMVVCVLFDLI